MQFLYDLGIKEMKEMKGFHNQIYQGTFDEDRIVIRVTDPLRRKMYEVKAEIELLQDLAATVNVTKPYAIKGKYVLRHQDKIYSFYAYIDGYHWNELEHTDAVIMQAGKDLAKIHLFTSQTKKQYQRPSFLDHHDLHLYQKHFKDQRYLDALKQTLKEIDLKTEEADYFLIHGDYLYSNIIYGQKQTVIDFDDCEYGYYQYDIAVYMFYYLLGGTPLERDIEGNRKRFKHFLKGYHSIRKTSITCLEDLNPFFRLRQFKLLGTIKAYGSDKNPWQNSYLKLSKQMIENNQPFI